MASRVDRAFERFRRGGDPRALARVFDATAEELYRLGFHLVGDAHAAEDLVQTTFLAAIEDASSFTPGSAVLPWLCGILANRARDHRRRRQRQQRLVLPAPGDAIDPVADASGRELGEAVARAVRALPEPYRQVLLLHLEHGLGGKEIAETQSKPEATVRSQIHRGLELLRKALPVGIAGFARAAMPPVRLHAVRAAVLARVGMPAAALAAFGTFSGVLAMKKILLGVLVLALLLVCAWPLWSPSEPEMQRSAPVATGSPLVVGAEVAAAEQPSPVTREDVAIGEPSVVAGLEVAVRWEANGEPVPDVTVRCLPGRQDGELWLRTARTDGAGIARFDKMLAGKAVLRGDRGGKVEVELIGEQMQRVVMSLPSGLDVRGRVVDVEDQPIAGAEVWLSIDANKDDGELVTHASGDGSFLLRGVSTERVLSAVAEGFACANPFVVTAKNADALVLRLRPAPGSLLAQVFDSAGRSVPNARVVVGVPVGGGDKRFVGELMGADLWPARYLRTDQEGRFTAVGLPPFRWPVWVRAPGHALWHEDVQIDERAATPLMVRLQVGASVGGRVTTKEGAPASGARVVAWRVGPPVDSRIIPLAPLAGAPGFTRAGTEAVADEDGRFVLSHLTTGKTNVHVGLASVTVRDELDLADGQQVTWNPVIAAPSGLQLRGIVVDPDGKPLAGWLVHDKVDNHSVDTDAEGKFQRLNVKDQLHPLRVRASKAIDRWLEVGDQRPGPQAVRIEVPWTFIPTARLHGSIVAADGGVLPRIDNLQLVEQPDTKDARVLRDELMANWVQRDDGRFDVMLAEGHYRLVASGLGFRDVTLGEWDVGRGVELDVGALRLPALPAPGRIAITVVDSAGKRVPQAWVTIHSPGRGWNQGSYIATKEGAGASDVSPGRWILSTRDNVTLTSQEVEVVSGRTTEVVLRVPDGVRFLLRVPSGQGPVQMSWRDANGTLVCESGESIYPRTEPELRERSIAPGRYTIEVKDEQGRTAMASADIRAADPPVVVDLPLPHQ